MRRKRRDKKAIAECSSKEADTPVGPAKLHTGHAPRYVGAGAGAKRAWRNDAEHPLTLAYAKGQLIRGNELYTAQQRYDAGEEYRCLFEAMHRSGRDSTDMNLVSGGSGIEISQMIVDAVRRIAAVESHLKSRSFATSAEKGGGHQRRSASRAGTTTTRPSFLGSARPSIISSMLSPQPGGYSLFAVHERPWRHRDRSPIQRETVGHSVFVGYISLFENKSRFLCDLCYSGPFSFRWADYL